MSVYAASAMAAQSHAQLMSPACGPRDDILERLSTNYGESTIAVALTSAGGLIEVLTAEDGETWTIIVTSPRGMLSCLVASGEGWRSFKKPRPYPGPKT